MTNVTSTRTDTWVDPFTLELFQNFKKDNWEMMLNAEKPSPKKIVEDLMQFDALVRDAEEFIEVVTEHFTGYSCDHSAESIAKAYMQKHR